MVPLAISPGPREGLARAEGSRVSAHVR